MPSISEEIAVKENRLCNATIRTYGLIILLIEALEKVV